jgi:hypothetical protein
MTTAIAVAAVVAFSFALGSLIRQVDGPTLRRWRLSRKWDVSRLAREFIAAADEPLATLRGLTHMINAWERGARRPSERYWLLYLRVFPECVNGETPNGSAKQTEVLPGTAGIDAMGAATFSSPANVDPGDFRALAATVRVLEQQIAGLSTRLEELSRNGDGEGQRRDRRKRKKTRSAQLRWNWMPFWTVLFPSLAS